MNKLVILHIVGIFLFFNITALALPQEQGITFEFPKVKGMDLNSDIPVYGPDNLWDYINGAADAFLLYGFEKLFMAEYTKGDNTYTAEVYMHKDELNAYGMYASERSPDYNFSGPGIQGYGEDIFHHFVRGKAYVKINAFPGADKGMLLKLAGKIEKEIGGAHRRPEVFDLFPKTIIAGSSVSSGTASSLARLIPNTEYYIPQSFLGHSFLNEVCSMDYMLRGKNVKAFLWQGTEGLEKLKERAPDIKKDGNTFIIEDKYNGLLYIAVSGDRCLGLQGVKDSAAALDFINEWLSLLQ